MLIIWECPKCGGFEETSSEVTRVEHIHKGVFYGLKIIDQKEIMNEEQED